MTYILTILDTVAVQSYIFGSNRLRENIGASELVRRATEQWVYELLPKPHNIKDSQIKDRRIEAGELRAEVVYAGGGNTLIIFASETEAKTFVSQLSEKLITEAPGIELAVVHLPLDWQTEALGGKRSGKVFEALKALASLKRSQKGHHPLGSLGVTAICQSTDQVATTTNEKYKSSNEPTRLISAEVEAKLSVERDLRHGFGPSGYEMVRDFDKIGSKDEASYLAVVHADGNNMRRRVEQIAAHLADPAQNRDYILAMREFSQRVKKAADESIEVLKQRLLTSIRFDEVGQETIMEAVPVQDKQIPFRLLIAGGDDLTFICDGRLALTLTSFYLSTFEQKCTEVGLDKVHACAGIAVVKTHYPFARAYQLAEALCANAKAWVKKEEGEFSALDWHFAPGGLMGNLAFIRHREYQLSEHTSLLMRPLALLKDQGGWRNWPIFEKVVTAFKQEEWATKRNKVKRFQQALRADKEGVRQFLAAYSVELPVIDANQPSLQETGWAGEYCGYYDAIEATDFYVPLATQEGGR